VGGNQILQSVADGFGSYSALFTADCRKVYGEDVIKDNMLCAGGVDGEDSCERDSGSPMTCRQEGAQSDNLCGLASYGLSCGLQGVPGVYTQVSHFIGWIQDNQE
jgi:secreted trypsin-like serine protease